MTSTLNGHSGRNFQSSQQMTCAHMNGSPVLNWELQTHSQTHTVPCIYLTGYTQSRSADYNLSNREASLASLLQVCMSIAQKHALHYCNRQIQSLMILGYVRVEFTLSKLEIQLLLVQQGITLSYWEIAVWTLEKTFSGVFHSTLNYLFQESFQGAHAIPYTTLHARCCEEPIVQLPACGA